MKRINTTPTMGALYNGWLYVCLQTDHIGIAYYSIEDQQRIVTVAHTIVINHL